MDLSRQPIPIPNLGQCTAKTDIVSETALSELIDFLRDLLYMEKYLSRDQKQCVVHRVLRWLVNRENPVAPAVTHVTPDLSPETLAEIYIWALSHAGPRLDLCLSLDEHFRDSFFAKWIQ